MDEHANPDAGISPSPDDLSVAFAAVSAELVDALDHALPAWVEGQVERLMMAWSGSHPPEVAAAAVEAGARARADLVGRLRELFELDVDEQQTNPLSILRGAAVYPTVVLEAAGVPHVVRDDEAVRQFPEDVYDLTPTSFGEIDESVHEPGLRWGAAKAFVVLSRRRGAPSAPLVSPDPEPRVVAFVPDLMDRSKVTAAIDGIEMCANPAALASTLDQLGDGDVALVDLGRPPVIGVLAGADLTTGVRVIGFASHVDDETFTAAEQAGCTEVLARSVFFRRLQGTNLL